MIGGSSSHRIFLAIGSNIEPRSSNLESAIKQLIQAKIIIKQQSHIYLTKPWGYLDQPEFLNMVIEGETDCTPAELLITVKKIEFEMGRKKTIKNGPRNIDIDILLYDMIQFENSKLKIPHPNMTERIFVMRPLDDLVPDLVIPGKDQTVHQYVIGLNPDGIRTWSENNV